MKRVLLLAALPLTLLALWAAGSLDRRDVATIDITAQRPTELRGAVIARLASLGGVRIGEQTSFASGGSAELTFRLPTARLDEALTALGQLGGEVTDQRVDLSAAAGEAQRLTERLDDVEGCLEAAVGAPAGALPRRVADCRTNLRDAAGQLASSRVDLAETTLEVRLRPSNATNPILVAAVVVLLVAAVGMTILVWRAARARQADVDLRDLDFGELGGDPFLRRN